nr:uncharacterized protein LOC109409781 [Aedes albopictus]XP_029716916.1 uncharacterized protein LOC115260148 [Aedes albopictus]
MSLVCGSCAGDIGDIQIECQGFCKATFHPSCCGVAADTFEEVMRLNQFLWFCPSCKSLMKDMRFRNTSLAAYEVGQEHALNSHSDIMKNLKTEIMNELKAEIRTNFAKLINSSSCTPKSSKRVGIDPRFTRSRRLFNTAAKPTMDKQPPLLLGTGSTPSPSIEIATVPPNQPKFWLYLSRIARDVSVEQVCALAKKRLGTEDVQVVRLVAKGRDIRTMSFISFKIGMNLELKSKALSTSTWPKGVLYREFTDNRSDENFWRPGAVAASDDPLSISPEAVVLME